MGTKGRTRKWGRYVWVVAALVVVAAAVVLLLARRSPVVRWSEVLAAAAKQRTMDGAGRLYAPDGSQWQAAVWVRVDGQNAFTENSLLVPLSGGEAKPGPEVLALTRAVNYLDSEQGIVSRLARANLTQAARTTQFAGRPAQEVTAAPPPGWDPEMAGLRWRFYLDPKTHLVRGLDLLAAGKLVAKIEYHYNQPLPPSFRAR